MCTFKFPSILSSFLVAFPAILNATHIKGAETIVNAIDQQSLSVAITVVGYVEKDAGFLFGGGTLNFGDGSEIQGQFESEIINLGDNLDKVSFTIIHTYSSINGAGYLISYSEIGRNENLMI